MKTKHTEIAILALLMLSSVTLLTSVKATPWPSLPSTPVQLTIVNGTTSYFISTLSGVPGGYDVHNGVYSNWCAEAYKHMDRDVSHNVTLYSSLSPPSALSSINWIAINYILNHKQGTMLDVQYAIWFFTDASPPTGYPLAQAMIDAANANPTYDPNTGAVLAIICLRQDDTGVQNTIIELGRVISPTYSDSTPPTGSVLINFGAAYTTSTSVTLILAYSDTGSGVSQVRYSNYGTWDTELWENPSVVKTWNLTSGDGTKTVYYQVKDNVGLVSPTYSDSITLDTVSPTGSLSVADDATYTTTTTVTLTLSASDATSSVVQMCLSNDGTFDTEPWEAYAISKSWTLSSVDGTKTVYVQFKDSAGLISSTYSDTIILDTTTPNGSITIAEGAAYTNSTSVTLTLSASDDTSGVANMRFSSDNIAWTPWESYSTSKAWILTIGEGTKTVYVRFKDNAGLTSSIYEDTIKLDTTKPTANAGSDQTVNEDTPITFDGSASSDNIDIISYDWNFGDETTGTGKTATHTYMDAGTYTVMLTVKDAAGNSATDTMIVTVPATGVVPLWIIGIIIAAIGILIAIMWRAKIALQG